ncbi:conserved hypothetical protein [Candidatus Desulfarcum epimagneticum]|uniref:OmpA-like domain-containing protein n=1 Tax=uncultured Desulfobacteraceae bacterium TaxID=218296 RepID=A0A484HIR4_9BACT|nr:conserved hypothetical protein [uncultured Desulfobacteraceae bacterium]
MENIKKYLKLYGLVGVIFVVGIWGVGCAMEEKTRVKYDPRPCKRPIMITPPVTATYTVCPMIVTPPVTAVYTVRDSDGDCVPDSKDRCPRTPFRAVIDARGCQKKFVIYFESDRWGFTPAARSILDSLVVLLKNDPEIEVAAHGHADSSASRAHNLRLSKRRANAAKQYLVSAGIPLSRVRHAYFGIDQPAAPNETKQGRAKNRRVNITLFRGGKSGEEMSAPCQSQLRKPGWQTPVTTKNWHLSSEELRLPGAPYSLEGLTFEQIVTDPAIQVRGDETSCGDCHDWASNISKIDYCGRIADFLTTDQDGEGEKPAILKNLFKDWKERDCPD